MKIMKSFKGRKVPGFDNEVYKLQIPIEYENSSRNDWVKDLKCVIDTGAEISSVPQKMLSYIYYNILQEDIPIKNAQQEYLGTSVMVSVKIQDFERNVEMIVSKLDFSLIGMNLLQEFEFFVNGPKKHFLLIY